MKKQNIINIIASLVALIVNFAIGFFLSPFIIKTMGVEAYGFINLANNFVSYFNIITVALNSMANRYISVNVYQNNMQNASKYYSSVIIANIIISLVLFVPIIIFSLFIDKVISVPINLVWDVRILFSIVFANFLIGTITSILGISYFVRNKLYISSIRNIVSTLVKAAALLLLFGFLAARVYYMAIATSCMVIITIVWDLICKRRMLPELKFRRQDFSFKTIKILMAAGIWNTVGQLSALLNTGLDLLLTNILLSATAMGVLATSKTIPLLIDQIMCTVSDTFAPDITNYYAHDDAKGVARELKNSAIIIGLILDVMIAGVISFGDVFYRLWVPGEDEKVLHLLTVLTMACTLISVTTVSVYVVFIAYNKVKVNALVSLGCSVLNIIIVIPLVKYTNFGIYAVAGVSTIIAILRNFIFTFPYAAKIVGVKWYTFYMQAIRNIVAVLLIVAVFELIKYFAAPIMVSWGGFIGICIGAALIGYMLIAIFLYDKEFYASAISQIKKKLKKN